MNSERLIEFENEIKELFESGKLPYPIHFSGGNEHQLMSVFRNPFLLDKNVKQNDWVFTTHRNHYHCLLKGMSPEELKKRIKNGRSMNAFSKKHKIFGSSIVGGINAISVGVALAIQKKGVRSHVWVFVGDGATDQGSFYEAAKYSEGHKLPITFVIEDNGLSVDTPKSERYNLDSNWEELTNHVIRYEYKRKYPHVQTGKWVNNYM